jgi:type II secretion system protein G
MLQLGVSMSGYGFQYIISAQETRIVAMEIGLDFFEVDCDRYPSTAEGLASLLVRPESVPSNVWHGPYRDRLSKDCWGRDYVYCSPGIHNTSTYDLYSCGVDGISKSNGSDPDDINNWDKTKPWRAYYLHFYRIQAIRSLMYKVSPLVVFPVVVLLGFGVWIYFKSRRRSRDEAA